MSLDYLTLFRYLKVILPVMKTIMCNEIANEMNEDLSIFIFCVSVTKYLLDTTSIVYFQLRLILRHQRMISLLIRALYDFLYRK